MILAAVFLDQFFIISSVDATHGRAVFKQPTEVTQLVNIPREAMLRGEHGETIHLADLRAGDTIFAVVKRSPNGQFVASSIRRGPMTPEELRKRYLPELP